MSQRVGNRPETLVGDYFGGAKTHLFGRARASIAAVGFVLLAGLSSAWAQEGEAGQWILKAAPDVTAVNPETDPVSEFRYQVAASEGVGVRARGQVIGHLKRSYEGQGFSGRYDFWVTGTFSPLARKQLGHRGFTVTENVDETYGFLD